MRGPGLRFIRTHRRASSTHTRTRRRRRLCRPRCAPLYQVRWQASPSGMSLACPHLQVTDTEVHYHTVGTAGATWTYNWHPYAAFRCAQLPSSARIRADEPRASFERLISRFLCFAICKRLIRRPCSTRAVTTKRAPSVRYRPAAAY